MNYRVVERYYGPEIRFNDWRPTQGDFVTDQRKVRPIWPDQLRYEGEALILAGGALQIYAKQPTVVTRSDYPYGGGGDVEIKVRFHFERMSEEGQVAFHFNDAIHGKGREGFRVEFEQGDVSAYLRGDEIYKGEFGPFGREAEHRLKLVTLADTYALALNGETLAKGQLDQTRQDNEGWTHVAIRDAAVQITTFEENFIVHDVEIPGWQRTQRIYQESLVQASLEANWIVNGKQPVVTEDSYLIRNMSNVILKKRFEGPIAVDMEVTPVIMENEYSAGVTDAIFIWMLDKPDGNLFEYLEALENASLRNLVELPFYWVDFGGSNNVTTRFRKNPHRWMIRQFQDRERLLDRGRTYRITLVQNGHFIEYWVDGEPWIRSYDPHPLESGHIGFRAFIGDLEVKRLEVWRIQ